MTTLEGHRIARGRRRCDQKPTAKRVRWRVRSNRQENGRCERSSAFRPTQHYRTCKPGVATTRKERRVGRVLGQTKKGRHPWRPFFPPSAKLRRLFYVAVG